jgi:hypothetical protein
MGIWLFRSLSVKILRRGRTRRWNAVLIFPKENGRKKMAIKQSLEPMQTKEWKMALDNLMEMEPQTAMQLMKGGVLKETLDRRVIDYVKAREKLGKVMDEREAEELAQMEILTPVNPNRDNLTPLTPEEEAMLNQWQISVQSTM